MDQSLPHCNNGLAGPIGTGIRELNLLPNLLRVEVLQAVLEIVVAGLVTAADGQRSLPNGTSFENLKTFFLCRHQSPGNHRSFEIVSERRTTLLSR